MQLPLVNALMDAADAPQLSAEVAELRSQLEAARAEIAALQKQLAAASAKAEFYYGLHADRQLAEAERIWGLR